MKSFLFVLLTLFTLNARADWNGGWSGGWRGNVTCTAQDRGWEEHWSGHRSCGECLAKHGRCVEVCTTTNYRCTAEGTNQQGSSESFEAYGADEYRTRDEAIGRCYSRGLSSCSVKSCDTNEEEVSRRGC